MLLANGDLRDEGATTASATVGRRAIFKRRLAVVDFALAAIQCDVMIEIGRYGHARIVRADAAIVLERLVFVVGRNGPLLMTVHVDGSRRSLRVVMLMASTVNWYIQVVVVEEEIRIIGLLQSNFLLLQTQFSM